MNARLVAQRTGFLWRHLLPLRCPWAPRIVYIEPTNTCNLRCVMCPQSSSKAQRGFMEFDLFKKVVAELPRSSHVHLYFRGEALLHPRIGDMTDYIRRLGRNRLTLVTNGTVSVAGLKANRVVFSFDAPDRDTYESIRRGADYEVTLRHLEEAICSGSFDEVVATIIEMPRTEQQLGAFAQDMYRLGVTGVEAKRYLHWDAECKEGFNGSTPCLLPWHTLGVYWDGTVTPCCVDFEGEMAIGNAGDSGLMGLWNNDRMIGLRRRLRSCKYGCKDALTLVNPHERLKNRR